MADPDGYEFDVLRPLTPAVLRYHPQIQRVSLCPDAMATPWHTRNIGT
jgi:hypothetical protein